MFGFSMELKVFCISCSSLTITLMTIGSMASLLLFKCSKNLMNQIPSYMMTDNATNSTSIVDRAMHDYFLLLQDMVQLLSKNVNLEVDFLSSKSSPQSALV